MARVTLSSRFIFSAVITFAIVIVQILLFHYYIGFSTTPLFDARNSGQLDWDCTFPGLAQVLEIARKSGIDLIIVDPDLLDVLDNLAENKHGRSNQLPTFSGSSKKRQESLHKTIVHLVAINETSGGQPNLKIFYNALKSDGYVSLKYDDSSQSMQPEVYRRASHLFDDMPHDEIVAHRHTHDYDVAHQVGDEATQPSDSSYDGSEISKIYTEFISHIFILNNTKISQRDAAKWRQSCNVPGDLVHNPFIVVHIVVLYNFEYDPYNKWIQPSLIIDEIDRHKLLSYNVHSFDFRIPLDRYYLHPKKSITTVIPSRGSQAKRNPRSIRVFEPEGDRSFSYVNNSYIHCKPHPFNITSLIDNPRRMSNYLSALDVAKPIETGTTLSLLEDQLITAVQFMDTFSRAYDNFTYWFTGSSLLSYYKYCNLALLPVPPANRYDPDLVNLEIGLFSSEISESIIDDLINGLEIGVTALSNWKNSSIYVAFQLGDCPNLTFNLYFYELRKDFYQYYFVTKSTMTTNRKFSKRSTQIAGHHVFDTRNLEICWTNLDNLTPFRVPCDIHDHLRRIYII